MFIDRGSHRPGYDELQGRELQMDPLQSSHQKAHNADRLQ